MSTNYATISVSEFKAVCLRLLREIAQTGKPIIITRDNIPIAMVSPPPQTLGSDRSQIFGSMKSSTKIKGDLLAPLEVEWDALA